MIGGFDRLEQVYEIEYVESPLTASGEPVETHSATELRELSRGAFLFQSLGDETRPTARPTIT